MIGKTLSASIVGIDAKPIYIEVDAVLAQLPSFTIVGLPDKAVQEAKERIVSAVKNSGFEWPRKKIVVNLAPADIPKTGTGFDLPIAIAILAASGQVEFDHTNSIFVGELSLEGELRSINGALPISLQAKDMSIENLLLPKNNALEAGLVEGMNVYGAQNLLEVVQHLNSDFSIEKTSSDFSKVIKDSEHDLDFSFIKGQETAKRAAIIAAAGGHNLLLTGSPGSGKTMISRALPSILPDLTFDEALEVTKVYSVSNMIPSDSSMILKRPFRSPHHTASTTSIIGGGKFPRPGELSLAHRGILFLDEFTEFSPFTMEGLRQPIEDKKVVISRVAGTLVFPANFMLVAAMNPCKCGWLGDPERNCSCTPMIIEKYRRKVSGPILDRIDLQVVVNRVRLDDLSSKKVESESSKEIKIRVQKARDIQLNRFSGHKNIFCNAEMPQRMIEEVCKMTDEAKELLLKAAKKLDLSARSYFRIIKVGRTIADLEDESIISKNHIAEALQYRINE